MSQPELTGRPPLLDLAGVAAFLGTTERHVRRLVFERRIPYLKLGNRLRFDPARLVPWLESLAVDEERRQVGSASRALRADAPGTTMGQRSRPRSISEPPRRTSASG